MTDEEILLAIVPDDALETIRELEGENRKLKKKIKKLVKKEKAEKIIIEIDDLYPFEDYTELPVYYYCPNCGFLFDTVFDFEGEISRGIYPVDKNKIKHCINCGQKIDWKN